MTEKDQNKTLTLKPKLGLSGSVNAAQMKQSVVQQPSKSSKTVTVVQVKKRSFNKAEETVKKDRPREESQISNNQVSKAALNGLTEDELNLRLKVLKEAEHRTKVNREIEEQRKKIQEEVSGEPALEEVRVEAKVEEVRLEKKEEVTPEVATFQEPEVPEVRQNVSKVKLIERNALDDAELERASKKSKVEVKLVKTKREEVRRNSSGKINLSRLDAEEEFVKTRSMASIRRAREKARKNEHNSAEQEKFVREVILPEFITVQDLAVRMAERGTDVIKELMKLGMIVHLSNSIDADTAELVIQTFGHKVKRVTESDVENILVSEEDEEDTLEHRPPVVTIMGHVDHGKTSLLDALRSTDVAADEAGGITQHIGAYQIQLESGDHITFLDTPGHEAFTAMRSRGAKVTDIVVLVVAADDGIMAQTVEALNHAKAAKVPIIVAINKIDKPGADVERVKNELLTHELVPEEYGGDTMVVEISAKQKINLDKLEEAILIQAEVLNLRANSNRVAFGAVVESRVDKGVGSIATLLVQKGTLKVGDILVAGSTSGKVRSLINDKGVAIESATPSMPVEITGLDEAPEAGDSFYVVASEKQAREISEFRTKKIRNIRTSVGQRASLEELFQKASVDGKFKELPIIVKGDVNGSIEAIVGSVSKLSNPEVKIKILHSAVGAINESDISLSSATGAMIIGFNVRANQNAKDMAQKSGVDIRYYSIIYNLIDDIKAALSGMLDPVYREEYLGNVEIRQVFNVSKYGKIAGSFVTAGIIKRGAKVRLLRDNVVIHEGKLKTLRRFKDDVKEVKEGFECGIAFENYEDIKEKDTVEVFEIIEERQSL